MKILLIDDHKLFAKSIQLLCQQYDEVDVIDTITSNFNDEIGRASCRERV